MPTCRGGSARGCGVRGRVRADEVVFHRPGSYSPAWGCLRAREVAFGLTRSVSGRPGCCRFQAGIPWGRGLDFQDAGRPSRTPSRTAFWRAGPRRRGLSRVLDASPPTRPPGQTTERNTDNDPTRPNTATPGRNRHTRTTTPSNPKNRESSSHAPLWRHGASWWR